MPLAASIEFPRADVDALFRQIDRAQKEVGMKLLPSLCPEMDSRQMYEAACAVAAILPLPAAAERKLQ